MNTGKTVNVTPRMFFFSLRKETVTDRNKQKRDHRPQELHKSRDGLGGLAHCR